MPELPIHTERITAGNLHRLLPLFESVYRKKISVENLRRKYDTDYTGKSWYGHLAFNDKNEPIAFNGCFPYRVQYNGVTEIAAQFGDSMTRADWLRKGLFSQLTSQTEALLVADGISFAFGFPNKNSESPYVKNLNWKMQEPLCGFKIPVSSVPVGKILNKIGIKTSKEKTERILAPFLVSEKIFPNSLAEPGAATLIHDEAFYQYKTYTPNFITSFGSTRVWLKVENFMAVGDIGTDDEQELLHVIKGLKQLATKLALPEIVLQFSPGTKKEQILRRHFPSFTSLPVGVKNFSSKIPLEKLKFCFGDFDTF